MFAVFSGKAGSSWSRASGTTSTAEMAAVAKSVDEARPPEFLKHRALRESAGEPLECEILRTTAVPAVVPTAAEFVGEARLPQ